MVENPPLFRPTYPLHMVWLATNLCNARCLHCSSNSARPLPDELTTAEARRMCDQLAACGVVDLAVSGGEPLLRGDILTVLAHAKRRGMTIGIGTNGSTVRPETTRALADIGLDRIQISIDGIGTTHDEMRKWPGLFDRATRAIATAREAGIRTHVCFTITATNERQIEAVARLAVKLGVKRLNLSRFVATGRGSSALEIPDEEWRGVAERCQAIREEWRGALEVVTHLAQQILVDEDVRCMPSFIGCQAGVGQGCIQADGTVLPCVLLPMPLGNIRNRAFADIWRNSPFNRALRDRAQLRGECGSCSQKARCGGCRAVAFARTGDPFASDPRCWLPPKRVGDRRRRLAVVSS